MSKITFINLCNHPIDEQLSGLQLPKGEELRVEYKSETAERLYISDSKFVPVFRTVFMLNQELPPKLPNTYYIVSNLALNVIPADRDDFLSPAKIKRDSNGAIIGCIGFRGRD